MALANRVEEDQHRRSNIVLGEFLLAQQVRQPTAEEAAAARRKSIFDRIRRCAAITDFHLSLVIGHKRNGIIGRESRAATQEIPLLYLVGGDT